MNCKAFSVRCLPVVMAASLLVGCANMSESQKSTATGAAIGAAAGAVLSSTTGGKAGTGAVIGGAIGAVAGNLWSKRMEEKRATMERATVGTGVSVIRTQDNQLQLNIPSDVSFDVNSARLRPELRNVLDQFSTGLDRSMQVRVVGHTDSTGSDSVNNPLSVQRAQAVREYLSTRGLAGDRIMADGRGAREPVADNSSEMGRAKNRRVEIFLSEPAPART